MLGPVPPRLVSTHPRTSKSAFSSTTPSRSQHRLALGAREAAVAHGPRARRVDRVLAAIRASTPLAFAIREPVCWVAMTSLIAQKWNPEELHDAHLPAPPARQGR